MISVSKETSKDRRRWLRLNYTQGIARTNLRGVAAYALNSECIPVMVMKRLEMIVGRVSVRL